jgi:FkbM family methyltransferase
MKKKNIVFLFMAFIIFLFVVIFSYQPIRLNVSFYQKVRIYAIALFRNPLCSATDALKGLSLTQQVLDLTPEFKSKIKFISRDSEGFELWETPKGSFWTPSKFDNEVLAFCLMEQESKVYGDGAVGVQSGDIVLDCGANIGVYTREALTAGAKLVVAIEPSPKNIKCLQKNFKTEIEQGRVIVYEKGVWNREEVLKFNVSDASVEDSFVTAVPWTKKTLDVPVTTIDKIVHELKLDHVNFIKMDIEGSEQNALAGAKETISKYKPRMAVVTEHTEDHLLNSEKVVTILRGIYPNYQTKCGECDIQNNKVITPEVIFFF